MTPLHHSPSDAAGRRAGAASMASSLGFSDIPPFHAGSPAPASFLEWWQASYAERSALAAEIDAFLGAE
jgi:hypothetical protein